MRTKQNPQFPTLSGANRFGAQMGRHHALLDFDEPRNIRLFRMAIDSGGYDDGGAYWGVGEPIYIAQDKDGDRTYVRAFTRDKAAFILGVANAALVNPIPLRDWTDYGCALLDGRAPMPEGKDRDDVIAWMRANGAKMGQPV